MKLEPFNYIFMRVSGVRYSQTASKVYNPGLATSCLCEVANKIHGLPNAQIIIMARRFYDPSWHPSCS